ncbi:MAG: ATP-grasp domain-containing protein [Muribaculaceae bacterium]|nr:ATP-grasp domain-containing protein [Muribaculaceae bacterium]
MNKRKKLLLLGGLSYLKPVIETAHRLGIWVATADYCPQNPAHQWSDEYFNVSITDFDAILSLCRKLKIDGILSFATDPGVVTAAKVAEILELPSPLNSVSTSILQNKFLFRTFLKNHNFNVPDFALFSSPSEAEEIFRDRGINSPVSNPKVIIKPVDSAGSKGVKVADTPDRINDCASEALKYSLSGRGIIEEFIDKSGTSSDSECFFENGILSFCSFSSQLFDNKSVGNLTPSCYLWPSDWSRSVKDYFKDELQRLGSLLNVGTGLFNVECCVDKEGTTYIMEFSPRGGGNRLAEALKFSTGIDLIEMEVKRSVGIKNTVFPQLHSFHPTALLVVHANNSGYFNGLSISPDIEQAVIDIRLIAKKGDYVKPFSSANYALGTLLIDLEKIQNLSSSSRRDNTEIGNLLQNEIFVDLSADNQFLIRFI